MNRRRFLALASAFASACATSGTPIARLPFTPAPEPQAAPVPPIVTPPTRLLPYFGFWQDSSPDTRPFSNVMMLAPGFNDDAAYARTLDAIANDSRAIIWQANFFDARDGAYVLSDDYIAAWQQLRALISNNLSRTIAIQLCDEPDAYAWTNVSPTNPYNPNKSKAAIESAIAMVKNDLPSLKCTLNISAVQDGWQPPSGLDSIGVECYGSSWEMGIESLKQLTASPIWILLPGFVDGDPAEADAELATRVFSLATRCASDTRIEFAIVFLYCCSDTSTGDKSFYSVNSGKLPKTQAAIEAIGLRVLSGKPPAI